MYRTIRLCSSRGGYESLPEPPCVLDLGLLRSQFEAEGIPVIDARVMLIASLEAEVTISRAGRLLFKTEDEAVAQRTLDRLRPALEHARRALGGVRGPARRTPRGGER